MRVLFPFGPQLGQLAVRLCLFASVGSAVILVIGGVVPRLLSMQPTLITLRGSMVVCLALFLAGGWGLARDIDFDDQLRRYFGTADLAAIEPGSLAAGIDRMKVDLGLEKDPARRFALWALLQMLGEAPDLDVAFKDEANREAARNFMDLVGRTEES